MELDHLRYFVVLAREGNYLKAAADLCISQSQLSKKIMRLEDELGVQLIDRSRRKITVTDAGNLVLGRADEVLAAYQKLADGLEEFHTTPLPSLPILSIPVLAPYKIPSLLAAFQATHPECEVQVTEREANAILTALDAGQAEVGIVRESFLDAGQFDRVRLCRDEAVVLVPRNHPLAGRTSVDLGDLAGEDFLFPDRQTLLHETYRNLCLSRGFEPKVVHTSTHNENLVELVAAGAGVALMMRTVAEYRPHEKVAILTLEAPLVSYLVAAWPKERPLSEPGRIFIGYLRHTYSQLE